MEEKKN